MSSIGASSNRLSATAAARQLSVRVVGKVQHVGFRYFVRTAAKRLGITGWVRNENDGCVKVIAEGPSDQLRILLRSLNVGPSLAKVEDLEFTWSEASGSFADFQIK